MAAAANFLASNPRRRPARRCDFVRVDTSIDDINARFSQMLGGFFEDDELQAPIPITPRFARFAERPEAADTNGGYVGTAAYRRDPLLSEPFSVLLDRSRRCPALAVGPNVAAAQQRATERAVSAAAAARSSPNNVTLVESPSNRPHNRLVESFDAARDAVMVELFDEEQAEEDKKQGGDDSLATAAPDIPLLESPRRAKRASLNLKINLPSRPSKVPKNHHSVEEGSIGTFSLPSASSSPTQDGPPATDGPIPQDVVICMECNEGHDETSNRVPCASKKLCFE